MIVACISNDEAEIPKKNLALAPDIQHDGSLAVSVGKHYAVYAMRRNPDSAAVWYFIYTDLNHLWWMPASIFTVSDATLPKDWVDTYIRTDMFSSYPSLHSWKIEEGIIDGDKAAEATYLDEVRRDPTFPTQQELNALNEAFHKQQRFNEYNEKLTIAKERGWELPEKPADT